MSTIQHAQIPFIQSRTHQNLISAWAGESQARRQYLDAAERCENAQLHVIAHAFRFTAAQEKEHASIYRGLLTALGGRVQEESAASVMLPDEPLNILRAVIQSEHDEWDKLYPAYARIAEEEGYPRVATAFTRIAETEQLHAQRFLQFAKALADGTLFRNASRVGWLCLPCGHLHYGSEAPAHCSTCGRSRGHFIRSDFHPFTVGEE
ncbi:MAG: rubrerythrin family protein [Clostridia bacterium]|nr:rubrerythrin family protein [Clostridia bacterium]